MDAARDPVRRAAFSPSDEDHPVLLGGGGNGQPEAVDLLFDVAFQAGEGDIPTSIGIYMNDPNTGPRGGNAVLEQVIPVSFFDDGGASFVNGVSAYSTASYGTYAYVNGITSQMDALGLDDAGAIARVYQRDVLIDSVSAPVITPSPEADPPQTKIMFNPLGIEFDDHDHYRIRILDHEPPVDMQMLFGVEGVAGQDGTASMVSWNAEGSVTGLLSKLTPAYFTPAPESETTCSVESTSGGSTAFYLLAASSSDRNNVVAKGTGFDYAGQPVMIRVYGDGELIGEQESSFYYSDGYGYAIAANFGGPSFSEGQTIAVRGWVPTSAIQPNAPAALTQGAITGTVQEGESVSMEQPVWGNPLAGFISDSVEWFIYDDEEQTSKFASTSLDPGTPWVLPAGSGGKWLTCQVVRTAWLDEAHTTSSSGASNWLPVQQIAAP